MREKADSIATAIKAELCPNAILLFGSTARGTETIDSDIDFCLLFERLPFRKLEILRKARKIARPLYRGSLDFVAYSTQEWLDFIAAGASFETQIKLEAIPL